MELESVLNVFADSFVFNHRSIVLFCEWDGEEVHKIGHILRMS